MKEINKVYPINDKKVLLIGYDLETKEEVRLNGYRNKKLNKFFYEKYSGNVVFTHFSEIEDVIEEKIIVETEEILETKEQQLNYLIKKEVSKELGFLKSITILFWFAFKYDKFLFFLDCIKKNCNITMAFIRTKKQ